LTAIAAKNKRLTLDELLNDYKLEMPEEQEQQNVSLKGKVIKFTW
jgi:hypothetical protein